MSDPLIFKLLLLQCSIVYGGLKGSGWLSHNLGVVSLHTCTCKFYVHVLLTFVTVS